MPHRRDLLKGAAFGVGVTVASLGTSFYRVMGGGMPLLAEPGEPGPDVALEFGGAPTPGERTPAQTDGPFYTPASPARRDLREPGHAGAELELFGRVCGIDGTPIAGAVLDFWHADERGDYDNHGYRYRAHQRTDSQGRYSLLTIQPAPYMNRAPHVHVKVRGADTPTLTTQLYFPDSTRLNEVDSIFDPALLVERIGEERGVVGARFDFVLDGGAS